MRFVIVFSIVNNRERHSCSRSKPRNMLGSLVSSVRVNRFDRNEKSASRRNSDGINDETFRSVVGLVRLLSDKHRTTLREPLRRKSFRRRSTFGFAVFAGVRSRRTRYNALPIGRSPLSKTGSQVRGNSNTRTRSAKIASIGTTFGKCTARL